MNWDERYRKEAGTISDFVVHQAIPFYNQHILPVKTVIWPDPGAIEHDARFMVNRKIPGTPEWAMSQGVEHMFRKIRNTITKSVERLRPGSPETEEPKEQ